MLPLSTLDSALQTGSLLAFPVVFAGGVLASLTPCVYPLIPVTIAFLGSRSAATGKQTVILSIAYSAGIAVVYAMLGGVAALGGKMFGFVAVHPLTNLAIGIFLVLMALAMLDLLKLPLPSFFRNPGDGTKWGITGAFLFGLCSGLVISPCTAPVMGVLLLFVASRQSVIYGISLLFVFACGMSTILICLGVAAGVSARLPRPGIWLVTVKRVMAALMAGSGVYFIFKAVYLFL